MSIFLSITDTKKGMESEGTPFFPSTGVCVCVCKTALFDPLVGKWASDREWPGPLTLALDEGITACGRSPFF